jgi:hypothetical protein
MKDKVGLSRKLTGKQKQALLETVPDDDSQVPANERIAFLQAIHDGNYSRAQSVLQTVPGRRNPNAGPANGPSTP